jgi:hypothetical protein
MSQVLPDTAVLEGDHLDGDSQPTEDDDRRCTREDEELEETLEQPGGEASSYDESSPALVDVDSRPFADAPLPLAESDDRGE